MADYDFSEGGGADAPASLATFTHVSAAVVSLALIAGVGVWGYKLMVRDVSGVPVVRAAEGEMRVRPENPGGQLAQHQGLAVNEIAARGQAAGPVDQVMLAPPEVALAPEDQPIAPVPVGQNSPPSATGPAITELDADLPDTAPYGSAPLLADRLQQGTIDEVVAELMAEAPDSTVTEARIDVEGTKTVEARAVPSDVSVQPAVLTRVPDPAVAISVRPKLRPQNAALLVQQASVVRPAATNEIEASAIPSGTRLAQLGAFESADVARAEWARMETRFGDILAGKSRVVQRAETGGRTFYRLRAMGFVDLADARRFCSAVKAEGVDCIPVQVR